jgi:hypothetical protein
MAIASVLTADIVNSTALEQAEFKKLVKAIEVIIGANRHEFYRGDSFQVFIKNNGEALRLLLLLRTAAKKMQQEKDREIDIRGAIGLGNANTNSRSLKTSNDEAFILSGRMLDRLENDERIRIASSREDANCAFRAIGRFADYLLEKITPKQAAVLFELLKGETQTQAARKLKKSQATINKHAQAAGWKEIQYLLGEFEDTIKQFNLL